MLYDVAKFAAAVVLWYLVNQPAISSVTLQCIPSINPLVEIKKLLHELDSCKNTHDNNNNETFTRLKNTQLCQKSQKTEDMSVLVLPPHYGFAPHETRRSNMQISFQKNVQGMRNKMHNCQSFKSRVYINVITIVSALSVRIIDLFIEEQCS